MSVDGQSTESGDRSRLWALVARRVVWVTDERRDLDGVPSRAPALVAIVGREHYSERRRQYPILAGRDLDAVLAQELAGAPPTITVVSPGREDRREVAFFEIRPEALSIIGSALLWVPESLALAATLPGGRVATVERQGLRYFLAAGGLSQPAGGTVTTAGLFALACGLDVEDASVIDESGIRSRLLAGLRKIPRATLFRLRAPSLRPRLEVDWKPVATMAGAGLVAYLALASGYLALTRDLRERELAGLGGEVEKLLAAQREVDHLLAQQSALATVMADRRSTYRLWQAVSVAWSKGAAITRIQLQDTHLTLSGNAPAATDVLAAVADLPGFADARFSSPVRSGASGREDFSLTLALEPEKNGG